MERSKGYEELIARYLNGVVSSKEKESLLQWVSESPDNEKSFLEIKDTWDASLKIQGRESEQLLQFYKKQALRKHKLRVPEWISGVAVAAILIVGLVIGSLLYNLPPTTSQVELFSVPMGSRSQLTLTDGTVVKLNSDSKLELGKDFSSKNRIVYLTGEGYFEVQADRKNPFLVKTDKFDIQVTGTKFNVSSYAEDQIISTTLAEGTIQLSTKSNQKFLLKPGEKISFNQKTMAPLLEKAEVESDLAWLNGEFSFKEIPFPDLIRRLERWYDVKLKYEGNSFNSMIYSGKFKNQETIWQVLDALKLTTPISYSKTNFREFYLSYQAPK